MPRHLDILHFNDVYNIEPSSNGLGGAARFTTAVKRRTETSSGKGTPMLLLFSGDAYSPSLMSTMTHGKQMVPVLNHLGVAVACVGNHDLDHTLENFEVLRDQCSFPWLMANVTAPDTGAPLGGVQPYVLLERGGVKVGLVGLVEGDWAECLPTIEPEELVYEDFVAAGKRCARELRAQGAELLIALTHMRLPNDLRLLAEVPEFDMVLGGHDHSCHARVLPDTGALLVKSGTDFRDLTAISITMPDGATDGPAKRPTFEFECISIGAETPEDPEVAEIVLEYTAAMGARMDVVVGTSAVELDGRFASVRTSETNLGNLVADVFCEACRADCALINSGTLRSDALHPAGVLTYRTLMQILPMIDETVVITASGQQLLAALENGVSCYPRLEGRFPQVSGLSFVFDPAQPPGKRVAAADVRVRGEPLQLQRGYLVATKAFLWEGKDGYDCLVGAPAAKPPEVAPVLPNALRAFFTVLEVLSQMDPRAKVQGLARRWAHKSRANLQASSTLEGNCIRDPETGRYVVAPKVEGRISVLEPAVAAPP